MNMEDKDQISLLIKAIKSKDMQLARKLILDDKIRIAGLAAIHLLPFIEKAALLNDKILLQQLFKDSALSEFGGNVLWRMLGNSEAAMPLVLCGANLNIRKMGFSNSAILHVLSANNDPSKLQLAELMIDHGADIGAIDSKGNSVLKLAIEGGAPHDFLQKLMIHPKANFAKTADVIAASDRSKELMPILITAGSADDVTRSQRARDAILALLKNNGPHKMEAIQKILKYDVMPVDAYDPRTGYTPLQKAIWKRDAEVAELFLKRGADPNIKTSQGILPLWIASTHKESNLVILLLKYGADVHLSNKTGEKPIHGACEGKSLSNMLLLIRQKVDVNVADNAGNTPLSILSYRSRHENTAYSFIVRQLALAAFKGSKINTFDEGLIKKYLPTRKLFDASLQELQRMQKMEGDKGIPYYTFLIENVEKTSVLTRRDDCKNVFEDQTKLKELFPYYFCDLRNAYCFAKEREDLLMAREEFLRNHGSNDELKNFTLYYHPQTFHSMIWD